MHTELMSATDRAMARVDGLEAAIARTTTHGKSRPALRRLIQLHAAHGRAVYVELIRSAAELRATEPQALAA